MVDNVKTTTRATTHVHARMVIREEIVKYVRRLISKDFLNYFLIPGEPAFGTPDKWIRKLFYRLYLGVTKRDEAFLSG